MRIRVCKWSQFVSHGNSGKSGYDEAGTSYVIFSMQCFSTGAIIFKGAQMNFTRSTLVQNSTLSPGQLSLDNVNRAPSMWSKLFTPKCLSKASILLKAMQAKLGLFQKLFWRGGAVCFFSDPSTPRTHKESEPADHPGHVSVLINSAPLWIKYALTPRTSYPPHATPRTRWQQNTLPPHRTKKCLRPPPDNFWNSPYLVIDSASTQLAYYTRYWNGAQINLSYSPQSPTVKLTYYEGCPLQVTSSRTVL